MKRPIVADPLGYRKLALGLLADLMTNLRRATEVNELDRDLRFVLDPERAAIYFEAAGWAYLPAIEKLKRSGIIADARRRLKAARAERSARQRANARLPRRSRAAA